MSDSWCRDIFIKKNREPARIESRKGLTVHYHPISSVEAQHTGTELEPHRWKDRIQEG